MLSGIVGMTLGMVAVLRKRPRRCCQGHVSSSLVRLLNEKPISDVSRGEQEND
jgi:hypothetical protein